MAPKRKSVSAKAAAKEEAPPAKAAKTAAKEDEPKVEEPKPDEPAEAKTAEAEEPKEKETDAPKDTRPTVKDPVAFNPAEMTLNIVPTMGGKCLAALTDGGMQFLVAGARANVGLTAGRYFFEVKVIEALTPSQGSSIGRNKPPVPRQLVRVGFSLAGSSLVLGDATDGSVYFDSEGLFCADRKKTATSARFGKGQTVGVLLNLDPKSPNANTVSLFSKGQRVSKPMPLPEKLQGQPLFPHIAFRSVTLQVNFGPAPLAPLPFQCRMVQEAATADAKEAREVKPKDGKYEVLFPVAFPDEGTFDWLDGFLEKNPTYVELSDRKIQDWAVKSGVWKPKSNSWKNSNDKPEFNFGLQHMDDFSIHRCLAAVTQAIPRNYVLMEVKQNLTQAERKENLKRFTAPYFKTVAHVVMGEPPKEYKAEVQKKLLEEKQTKAEIAWRMRKVERERKRQAAQKQKEIAAAKKKAEEEAKKKAEEAAKKKAEEAAKKKEAEEKKDEGDKKEEKKEEEKKEEKEEEKKEEKKDEEKKDEEMKGEEADEKKEEPEEEPDEPMPQAELTEEEKKINFKPPTISDITQHTLSSCFHEFCIPAKDEGFDEVRFAWQNEAKSKAYLQEWVLERKKTSRIDDLQPSDWFKTKHTEFQKAVEEWKAKQDQFKSKKGTKKSADKDEDEAEMKMDIDIFSVEDVCDTGKGEPLFSSFALEDWALLSLRFELHLLQAAFKHDVNDAERVGVHENHLVFYYSKYYKKQLNPKLYGKETVQEVLDLVKDSLKIDPASKVLVSELDDEPESTSLFVKVQEESRRKRQQRIDAGDETARLSFKLLQQQQQVLDQKKHQQQQQKEQQQQRAEQQQQKKEQQKEQQKEGGGKGAAAQRKIAPKGDAQKIVPTSSVASKAEFVPPPSQMAPKAPVVPRVVPAKAAGASWQKPGGKDSSWKGSGKAGGKSGGKWPHTYAPRVAGKMGKK